MCLGIYNMQVCLHSRSDPFVSPVFCTAILEIPEKPSAYKGYSIFSSEYCRSAGIFCFQKGIISSEDVCSARFPVSALRKTAWPAPALPVQKNKKIPLPFFSAKRSAWQRNIKKAKSSCIFLTKRYTACIVMQFRFFQKSEQILIIRQSDAFC